MESTSAETPAWFFEKMKETTSRNGSVGRFMGGNLLWHIPVSGEYQSGCLAFGIWVVVAWLRLLLKGVAIDTF